MNENQMQLSSYDPVEIQIKASLVTDSAVEEEISKFLASRSTSEEIYGRGLRDDDIAKIAVRIEKNGEILPAFNSDNRTYQVGAGYMPSAFDRELIDMLPGETRKFTFPLESVEGESKELLNAEVTLNSIVEHRIPGLTDDWVRDNIAGCISVDDYRSQVRSFLESKVEPLRKCELENAVASELGSRLIGEIPQETIGEAMKESAKGFSEMLASKGVSFEEFCTREGMTEEQVNIELYVQMRQLLEQNAALDAYARHFKIEVSNEEVISFIPSSRDDEKFDVFKRYENEGNLEYLRQMAVRSKALQMAIDKAVVEEI